MANRGFFFIKINPENLLKVYTTNVKNLTNFFKKNKAKNNSPKNKKRLRPLYKSVSLLISWKSAPEFYRILNYIRILKNSRFYPVF